MSFRENLQFLRAQHNMTQEQLAMLLGVSRQAISKWESEKAYPEMDKLTMICELFGCTLDDLVMGDVQHPKTVFVETTEITERADSGKAYDSADSSGYETKGAAARAADAGAAAAHRTSAFQVPNMPVQDITGYDQEMRSFQRSVTAGVFAIIFGVGVAQFFDPDGTFGIAAGVGDFLMFVCIALGVLVGLLFLIPAGIQHENFVKKHPFVEDFYTDEDRKQASRILVWALCIGMAMIMVGIGIEVYCDEVLDMDDGWPSAMLLMFIACGVACFIYGGMEVSRVKVDDYNRDNERKESVRNGNATSGKLSWGQYTIINGAVCAVIMLVATIVALSMLFGWFGEPNIYFWMSWVVGALLCGVSSVIFSAVKSIKR